MPHVRNHECPVLNAKVGMRKEGKDRYDLVLVSERCDERTHRSASS